MTKEEIIKRVKEIVSKDKRFDIDTIIINFKTKSTTK